jgi:hypothetical protein
MVIMEGIIMAEKDFKKDHIIFGTIPKYDWSKIAEEKEKKNALKDG